MREIPALAPGLRNRLKAPGLKRIRERTMRHGLAQIVALKRATGLLAAADIPCLVLKGLPLGQRLYGHPLARSAQDIDLLVAPRTFQAAERVLLESGWRRASSTRRTGGGSSKRWNRCGGARPSSPSPTAPPFWKRRTGSCGWNPAGSPPPAPGASLPPRSWQSGAATDGRTWKGRGAGGDEAVAPAAANGLRPRPDTIQGKVHVRRPPSSGRAVAKLMETTSI